MLRVVMVGATMGIIGLIAVIIAFRAFAEKDPENKTKVPPFIFVMGAVAFILVCCAVLLMFSTPRP